MNEKGWTVVEFQTEFDSFSYFSNDILTYTYQIFWKFPSYFHSLKLFSKLRVVSIGFVFRDVQLIELFSKKWLKLHLFKKMPKKLGGWPTLKEIWADFESFWKNVDNYEVLTNYHDLFALNCRTLIHLSNDILDLMDLNLVKRYSITS